MTNKQALTAVRQNGVGFTKAEYEEALKQINNAINELEVLKHLYHIASRELEKIQIILKKAEDVK